MSTLIFILVFCLLKSISHTAVGFAKARARPEGLRVISESQCVKRVALQHPTSLQPGETLTREIKGGATQSFKVSLIAGQYVRLLIEQHGINLVAKLSDVEGKSIVEMDNPSGGHGPIFISTIAANSGDYQLQLRSPEKWANPGRYEVTIEVQREAIPADRDRVAAEKAFADGRQFSNAGTKESRTAAIQKYEQALVHWKEAGDRHWEPLTLYVIAGTYRRLGQLQKASEFFEKAISFQLDERDWRLAASSWNDRGVNYIDLGEHQMALECLSKALGLYQNHSDKRGQASVFNNIGLAHHKIGALTEALENYQKAIPLRQAENDQGGEFNVRNNVGGIHDVAGEPFKALEQYRETLKVWQELDKQGQLNNRDQLGVGFNNVAEAQNKLGEWEQARENYKQALQIFQASGNSQREAACLDNIGQLYQDLGEPELAREYYQKARQLLQERVKDPEAEGNVLGHIGALDLSQDRLREALQNLEGSFKLRQSPRGQGYALVNIGAVHVLQNNPQKALGFYDKALTLLKASRDQQGEALTFFKKGEAHRLLRNHPQALGDFSRALSLWRTIKNQRGEATTLLGIAQAELDLNHLGEALKHSEAAITIIESLRTNISSSRLRSSYFAIHQNYYELNIALNMGLYHREQSPQRLAAAFQASEKARARSWIDILQGARIEIAESVREGLQRQRREIRQRLAAKSDAQTRLLSGPHSAQQAEAIAKEIVGLINEERDVADRIRATNPKYAQLLQPEALNLSQIQGGLDVNALLVEFALGEKRSYMWVVSPDSINGFELAPRDQIEAVARRVIEALTARNREVKDESLPQKRARFNKAEAEYVEASAALSKMIMEPVAALLGTKRLVIVADGALQTIPFGALPIPTVSKISSDATNSRNFLSRDSNHATQTTSAKSSTAIPGAPRPLISEHEIVYLPSASVLALHRRELSTRKRAPYPIAVIADPVFDNQDERVAKAQRDSSQQRKDAAKTDTKAPAKLNAQNSAEPADSKHASQLAGALRDVGLDPTQPLPRLNHSLEEATSILQAASSRQAFSALHFKASRETATSPELSKYRIIHFATHGILDLQHPELSGIVLSMVDEKGQSRDGYLRLHEIYNLNLPAELVVLSACQTGVGKQIKGEGLIALTRGFMYAGAKSVVASLWKVDDAATAALMAEFYKQMFTNKLKPAAALRQAQLKVSKVKRWQSPYYWSGFFLQGDWN